MAGQTTASLMEQFASAAMMAEVSDDDSLVELLALVDQLEEAEAGGGDDFSHELLQQSRGLLSGILDGQAEDGDAALEQLLESVTSPTSSIW